MELLGAKTGPLLNWSHVKVMWCCGGYIFVPQIWIANPIAPTGVKTVQTYTATIIGSGASAAPVIPAIADQVKQMRVGARSTQHRGDA
jgi:hypothetical protein